MEWNRIQWSRIEWNRMEWNAIELNDFSIIEEEFGLLHLTSIDIVE